LLLGFKNSRIRVPPGSKYLEIRIKEATGNPKPSKPLQKPPGFMKEAAKKPAVFMQLFDFSIA
jgi:hypothetical protein